MTEPSSNLGTLPNINRRGGARPGAGRPRKPCPSCGSVADKIEVAGGRSVCPCTAALAQPFANTLVEHVNERPGTTFAAVTLACRVAVAAVAGALPACQLAKEPR